MLNWEHIKCSDKVSNSRQQPVQPQALAISSGNRRPGTTLKKQLIGKPVSMATIDMMNWLAVGNSKPFQL